MNKNSDGLTPFVDELGIAVVGGGRWARVYASVIAQSIFCDRKLFLCSPSNEKAWETWRSKNSLSSEPVICNYDDLIDHKDIKHVVVARKAADHAKTAITLLKKGKRVLLEKPMCLNLRELRALKDAFNDNNLWVSTVFSFNDALSFYLGSCSEKAEIETIYIEWFDKVDEFRWGEQKTYDPNLSVWEDLFPHIWSLLRLIFKAQRIELKSLSSCSTANNSEARFESADTKIKVLVNRNKKMRKRTIFLRGREFTADIDFSAWPIKCLINGRKQRVVSETNSPLTHQLESFVSSYSDNKKLPAFASFQTNYEAAITLFKFLEEQAQ